VAIGPLLPARLDLDLADVTSIDEPGLRTGRAVEGRQDLWDGEGCLVEVVDCAQHGSTTSNTAATTAPIASSTAAPTRASAAYANRALSTVPASPTRALIRQPHSPQLARPELASV